MYGRLTFHLLEICYNIFEAHRFHLLKGKADLCNHANCHTSIADWMGSIKYDIFV